MWYDVLMEIEYMCVYDGNGRLRVPFPWERLNQLAVGDSVRVFGCMSERSLRTSAGSWGKRRDGRIKVHLEKNGELICTLEREAQAEPPPPGRPSRYPILQALKPGELGLIPWLWPRGRDQGAIWRAIAREREKNKKIHAMPVARGVRIERLS